jgi:hypothetical protein
MPGGHGDIERWSARGELDHLLLALLLLRHLLGAHLDPRQLHELVLELLQKCRSRIERVQHLDLLAGEAPPVEIRAQRMAGDKGSREAARGGRTQPEPDERPTPKPCPVHFCSPDRVFRGMRGG